MQAIFDSERYKEFLNAMSKFHDYSLNNTILIAMQGGNLVKGFRQWEKEFPDLSVKPLLADVQQYEDFFAALEKASPVPIAFEQINSGANGYFSLI